MISCALVITPVLDKAAFHRTTSKVQGKNYLSVTDAKSFKHSTQDALSILNTYGSPYRAEGALQLGFVFVGATQLILQLPSIVQGNFISNQDGNGLVSSVVVLASVEQWRLACGKEILDPSLKECFNSISSHVSQLTSRLG